eukprot:TRINITY_DN24413_c0_g1_i6.p1 TRINITY_DN24413_c0_g1~~TRINITY_DN24413_c0_g1_i6.p1  ORF type:complete len:448 (-),score=60.73 TRINITY_DN24413_c0_g1_i6:267-1574(-)
MGNTGCSNIKNEDDAFLVLSLPFVAFARILSYLDLEARQNLRLVSRRFAAEVLYVDKTMREWRIELRHEDPDQVTKVLYKAQANGSKFLLRLDITACLLTEASTQKCCDFVNLWKDSSVIELVTNVKGSESFLSTVKFPRLDSVEIYTASQHDGTIVNNLITNHAHTLKSLRIGVLKYPVGLECQAPNLEVLSFFTRRVTQALSTMEFLKFGKCIKRLNLGNALIEPTEPEHLHLPNLKHLEISAQNDSGFQLVQENSAHVEVLKVTGSLKDTGSLKFIPKLLPKLKVLVLNTDKEVIEALLPTCKDTVEYLVIAISQDSITTEALKMKKLKCFALSDLTDDWGVKMIAMNKGSLKYFSCSGSGNQSLAMLENLPSDLPKMANIVVTWPEAPIPDMTWLRNRYPQCRITAKCGTEFKVHMTKYLKNIGQVLLSNL